MSRWLYSVVLVGTFAMAAVALAAAPTFDKVDTNKDGKISKSEGKAVKGLNFSKADKDKNGWLDRAEYEAAVG
jgi:hypothetical protein